MKLIELEHLHTYELSEETWALFDEFHDSLREEGAMLIDVPFDDDGLVEFNDLGDLVHTNTGLWLTVKKHGMAATIEAGDITIRSVPEQDFVASSDVDIIGNFVQQLNEELDSVHVRNVAAGVAL